MFLNMIGCSKDHYNLLEFIQHSVYFRRYKTSKHYSPHSTKEKEKKKAHTSIAKEGGRRVLRLLLAGHKNGIRVQGLEVKCLLSVWQGEGIKAIQ